MQNEEVETKQSWCVHVPLWAALSFLLILFVGASSVSLALNAHTTQHVESVLLDRLQEVSATLLKDNLILRKDSSVLQTLYAGEMATLDFDYRNYSQVRTLVSRVWDGIPNKEAVFFGLEDGSIGGLLNIDNQVHEFYSWTDINPGLLAVVPVLSVNPLHVDESKIEEEPYTEPFGDWYTTPNASVGVQWTGFYVSETYPTAIWNSVTFPIRDERGEFKGYFGIDLTTEGLSASFNELRITENTEIFAIEVDTGYLVMGLTPSDYTGVARLIKPEESSVPLIREIHAHIQTEAVEIPSSFRFSSATQGKVRVELSHVGEPGSGLHILLVVSIPENDLLADTKRMLTLSVAIVASVFAVSIVCFASMVVIIQISIFRLQQQFAFVESMKLEKIEYRFLFFYELIKIEQALVQTVHTLKLYSTFLPENLLEESSDEDEYSKGSESEAKQELVKEKSSHSEVQGTMFRRLSSSNHSHSIHGAHNKFEFGLQVNEITVMSIRLEKTIELISSFGPDCVLRLHKDILEMVHNSVHRYRGTVSRIYKDKVEASWNTNKPILAHQMQACKTALEIQQGLQSLHQEWEAEGLPQIEMRIGIASSHGWSGVMGSFSNRSFSVLGEPAEDSEVLRDFGVVSNLCVLVTGEIAEKVDKDFLTRCVDIIRTPSMLNPKKLRDIVVYELISRKKKEPDEWMYELENQKTEAKWNNFTNALGLMRQGRWTEALPLMEQFNENLKKDSNHSDWAALKHIEYCKEMIHQRQTGHGEGDVYTGRVLPCWHTHLRSHNI